MTGLLIEDVSMRFDLPNGASVQALKNVQLDIRTGELMAVLGPSGCGKTTLLNILAGFLAPTEGMVKLGGDPVTGPGPERGMVFQQGALFEWMNVRKNIGFGPSMKGTPSAEINARVDELLGIVGLQDFEDNEAQPIIDYLREFAQRPEFLCRFRWEVNSMAIWDNRCVQHYAVPDYNGKRRRMHRITIKGDVPV